MPRQITTQPQYANGFEIIGVQSRWKTDPALAGKSHTAVYFLDPPVRLSQGERPSAQVVRAMSSAASGSALPRWRRGSRAPRVSDDTRIDACRCIRGVRLLPTFDRVERRRVRACKELEAEVLACRDGRHTGHGDRADGQTIDHPRTLPRELDGRKRAGLPAGDAAFPAEAAGRRHAKAHSAGPGSVAVRPENPLTARAVVNRFWKQFFGTGLSASRRPRRQGEPPTHPELLDWLAVEFRESGWDVKHLVKLIVMSHTYRQVAGVRPSCATWTRTIACWPAKTHAASRRRSVRDNALAIAGLLNPELGGPPCKPYQPAHYYDGLQFPDRDYHADRDDQQYRRGIYMHWQRTFAHPMLANFDAPSREDCIAMRSCANSPQQALTLLNDPTFVEAARVWAGRLLPESAGSDAERLERAFEQAVARSPKPAEHARLIDFLARMRANISAAG